MENLEEIISSFRSNNPNQSQEAAMRLYDVNMILADFDKWLNFISANIESVSGIFNVKFALTLIHRFIMQNTSESIQGFIPSLKNLLLEIIHKNIDISLTELACDGYSQIADISEIMSLFLGNWRIKKFAPFMFRILEKKKPLSGEWYNKEFQKKLLSFFLAICRKIYQTDNYQDQDVFSLDRNIQISAQNFLHQFLIYVDYDVIIKCPILDLLFQMMQTYVQRKDQIITYLIIESVKPLMNIHDFYVNLFPHFYQFAFLYVSDINQPVEMRITVHEIFEIIEDFDNLDKNLLLKMTVKLSYTACEIGCEQNYDFNDYFIANLMKSDKSLSFKEVFMEICRDLLKLDNLTSIQILFYLINIFIEIYFYYIFDFKEFLLDLFKVCFFSEKCHPTIIEAGLKTLSHVVCYSPAYLGPIFEDLINWFIPNNYNPCSSQTFLDLLEEFPEPSDHFQYVFNYAKMLSINSNLNVRIRSLNIMTALFSNTPFKLKNNLELFQQIDLDSLLECQETYSEAIKLVGILIKVFPKYINTFVFNIIKNYKFDPSFELNLNMVKLLTKAVKTFSNSCIQYLGDISNIISFISEISKKKIENKEYEYLKIDSNCFVFQGYLLSIYDNIIDPAFIKAKIDDSLDDCADEYSNKVLRIVSHKISDVKQYLKEYNVSSSTKVALISRHGFCSALNDIIVSILSCLTEYIEEDSFYLYENDIISEDVFDLLNTVIFNGNIDGLIVEKLKILSEKESVFQGNVILSLAYFTVFCQNNLIPEVTLMTKKYMEENNFYLRHNIFKALNLIMFRKWEFIQNDVDYIKFLSDYSLKLIYSGQKMAPEMKDEIILTALLSSGINEIDVKKLISNLSYKKFTFTYTMLCRKMVSFYQLGQGNFPEEMARMAIFVISSENVVWNSISDDIKQFVINFKTQISDEQVLFLVNYNEHNLNLLNEHMGFS